MKITWKKEMMSTLDDVQRCLDELLQAHNDFEDAKRTSNQGAMLAAQIRIEDARLGVTEFSQRFENGLDDLARLDRMTSD